MGIDQAEFTPNGGANPGRVQMYYGNGVKDGNGTNPETTLIDNGGTIMNYDQVLLPCWGGENWKTTAELGNLVNYADTNCGHAFATHFSYTWLETPPNGQPAAPAGDPFPNTANFSSNPRDYEFNTMPAAVVQMPPTNPKGKVFTQWLTLVNAVNTPVTNPATVSLNVPRHNVDSIKAGSVDWIDGVDDQGGGTTCWNGNPGPCPMIAHYTFNTPFSASSSPPPQYGHVVYSDFHVTNAGTDGTQNFPKDECDGPWNGCTTGATCPMSAQERILEYMIWDLDSCVGPQAPSCPKLTCQQQGIACGPAGDGCGNQIDCGPCPDGGGSSGGCHAKDCGQQNINCGPASDGCGHLLMCGDCTAPATCGGGGTPGQCGGIQ
jgi:hypothetical protein